MCDLCKFLDDGVLDQLQTSLAVVQMLPQKGWRQRKMSVRIMSLLTRYNALKDLMVERLEADYQTSLERYRESPNQRNELFFRELQHARSQWLIKLGEIKKMIANAEPWLTVMEA